MREAEGQEAQEEERRARPGEPASRRPDAGGGGLVARTRGARPATLSIAAAGGTRRGGAPRRRAKAEVALKKTIAQLKAVPRPVADEAKLTKWLGYLGTEASYLGRIGKALAQGDKAKAQTLSVRLDRNSNLANDSVLAFGFDYCRLEPSRFS